MLSFNSERRRLNQRRGHIKTKVNTIIALICGAALASSCFGQRQYTVTALPSPTSDNNAVGWISEDGSTTFGVLMTPNPTSNPGLPFINQCYSMSNNGGLKLYPTPGFSCYVSGVNKNLQFGGTLLTASSFLPITAYVNLDGNFDPYGTHLPGLDYTMDPSCAPCAVPTSQTMGINDNGDVVGWVNGFDHIVPV